jgi:hypothetical protein
VNVPLTERDWLPRDVMYPVLTANGRPAAVGSTHSPLQPAVCDEHGRPLRLSVHKCRLLRTRWQVHLCLDKTVGKYIVGCAVGVGMSGTVLTD